jgi:phosphomevalonate kinase
MRRAPRGEASVLTPGCKWAISKAFRFFIVIGEEAAIRVLAPGKAMLAGEYGVLAGGPGIVAGVGRHLECAAFTATRLAIEGPGWSWEQGSAEPRELRFGLGAHRIAAAYLEGKGLEVAPLKLVLRDDLRATDGSKLGLGGSACTCVGVVAAVLARSGLEQDRTLIFKLAAVAHATAQGGAGSALDVAASTFGGTLWTRRFAVDDLLAASRVGSDRFAEAVDLAELPHRERLAQPWSLTLVYSGRPASTPALVQQIERFAARSPQDHARFLARTRSACEQLRQAIASKDMEGAREAMRAAEASLEELGCQAGVDLVTLEHHRILALCREAGAAAKVSGAGGGDCCVALSAEGDLAKLQQRLTRAGLTWISPNLDESGVRLLRDR